MSVTEYPRKLVPPERALAARFAALAATEQPPSPPRSPSMAELMTLELHYPTNWAYEGEVDVLYSDGSGERLR